MGKFFTVNRTGCFRDSKFPPWDLEARVLASLYQWRKEALARGTRPAPQETEACRSELRDVAMVVWEERLRHPSAGLATVEAVRPVLQDWIRRRHGTLTYRLTQVLSGHGCFGRYLCRLGREPTSGCHHCDTGDEDTALHTLQECPAWTEQRRDLVAFTGFDTSLPAVVRTMVGSEQGWDAVSSFCERVMLAKEEAERERERTSLLRSRQRRTRRRRRANGPSAAVSGRRGWVPGERVLARRYAVEMGARRVPRALTSPPVGRVTNRPTLGLNDVAGGFASPRHWMRPMGHRLPGPAGRPGQLPVALA